MLKQPLQSEFEPTSSISDYNFRFWSVVRKSRENLLYPTLSDTEDVADQAATSINIGIQDLLLNPNKGYEVGEIIGAMGNTEWIVTLYTTSTPINVSKA